MKNLWQRLSEENRFKIENQRTLYPTITRKLIEELETKYTYTDLRFESVIYLIQELTQENRDFVTLIDDLFNYEKI